MEFIPVRTWKSDFTRSTEPERYREILRRVNDEAKKKREEERKAERDDDELETAQAFAAMAGEAELVEFASTLDAYDRASYEALLENERLLDESKRRLQDMFDKAYRLPDGRHVFESEDGLRVFDENGVELAPDEISPEEIENYRPKWESVLSEQDTRRAFEEERTSILEFQNAADGAREKAKGELTQDEVDDLKSSLEEKMPDRVRDHLPDDPQPSQEADPEQPKAAWRPSVKLGLQNLA